MHSSSRGAAGGGWAAERHYNSAMEQSPSKPAKRAELSVSEVTRLVKALVESEPGLSAIWVRGEVSNVRLAGSGHLYFTLKDAGAQLRVAYFGFGRGKRKPPADGEALLVHGDVRVYERAGEYQLVADDLIRAGVGDLAAQFEALKRKLDEEGLFEAARKVALPAVPRHIAVVTSLTTAALQDVLNVLARRAPYAEVAVFHASVQGEGAPAEIIEALKAADICAGVELILLVRGGGSLEDLWCFNDEALARALAEIRRPVISGVGHEIDFTIADFVADQRAPTPSAAAEMAAPDAADLRSGVEQLRQRLLRGTLQAMQTAEAGLERLFDRRLIRDVVGQVEGLAQDADDHAGRLSTAAAAAVQLGAVRAYETQLATLALPLQRALDDAQYRLPQRREGLLRALRLRLDELAARLKAQAAELNACDPRAPKKLGFALVWAESGALVRSPEQVRAGERLRVEVRDGEFPAIRED